MQQSFGSSRAGSHPPLASHSPAGSAPPPYREGMDTAASSHLLAQHDHLSKTLPFVDVEDFETASRGFIGTLDPAVVRNAEGAVVWDADSYGFLEGEAPPTVNPSLWRQSRLLTMHGLYAEWRSRVMSVS